MVSAAPPLQSTITNDRHDPIVRFTIATLLSLSISSVVVRLVWIRRPLRSLFGLDDFVTICCVLLAGAHAACLAVALRDGFARRSAGLTIFRNETLQKALLAADILYPLATWLSRLATSAFCGRLTRRKTREYTAFLMLSGVALACGPIGMLIVGVQPPYSKPWRGVSDHPRTNFVRWIVIESLGILFELLLFSGMSALIWRLQMTTGKKSAVTFAFALRLPVIAIAAVRLRSLSQARNAVDPTFDYTTPQIWTLTELHYSIIAATIPSFHIFLKNLTTGWLADLRDMPETAMASKLTTSRSHGPTTSSRMKGSSKSQDRRSFIELQDLSGRDARNGAFAEASRKSPDEGRDGSGAQILVQRTVEIMRNT